MNKIKLKKNDFEPVGYKNPASTCKSITAAAPYYKSYRGQYVHRVYSGKNYFRYGKYTHTAVNFFCGMTGFVGSKGLLFDILHEDHVLCATCEGRAIGAGMDGARTINGKNVKYSPTRNRV